MHIKVKAVLNIVVAKPKSGLEAAIREDPAPLFESICDSFTSEFSEADQTAYITDIELMEVK